MNTETEKPCFCHSGIPCSRCCGPILDGSRQAATAEELMRSRYTANVVRNTRHLLASWHASTRPEHLAPDRMPDWTELKILETRAGGTTDNQGTVEFIARYTTAQGVGMLHERSRFVRENGRWLYLDGEILSSGICRQEKIGRNAPCPCGSGRKYKKCCLRR